MHERNKKMEQNDIINCADNNIDKKNIEKKNNKKILKKYIHVIRNINPLDDNMIKDIRNMSDEDKMEIIISFNAVVENVFSFIKVIYPETNI